MVTLSRRVFLAASMASLATPVLAKPIVRKTTLARSGFKSANEKLNIAGIGIGGKGASDIDTCNWENITALCDVDWKYAAGVFNKYPNAKKYKDFRKMLDECKDIDAVTIATPDHTHAITAMRCMEAGKHVYVQKPLTHTVYEARILREAAKKYGVATQMGNQGAATDQHRETAEAIWSGVIGDVYEMHSWTDRPAGWWPQGIKNPLPKQDVPETLDWDLWLGPAAVRPYNAGYCPFKWRGWWDFGCGALGDIACHNLSPVVKALRLEYPVSVECIHQIDVNPYTYPIESILHYQFPKRQGFPALDLFWYDGKLTPPPPKHAGQIKDLYKGAVNMFVGEKGILLMKAGKESIQVIANGEIITDFKKPNPMLPRLPFIPGNNTEKSDADRMHKQDWILSCKTGSVSGTNFDHAGPLTEWVVMGNISLRFPYQKLEWDGANMRFTNCKEANKYVTKEYRKGWELL